MSIIKSSPDLWYQKKKADVSSDPSKYANWRVEDGNLYIHLSCLQTNPILSDSNPWKTVSAPGLRQAIIRDAHDRPYAAHCGIDKIYHRVSSYFYWPAIYRDVSKFVRSCSQCQRYKSIQTGPCGLIRERTAAEPWSIVAGDIIRPFPPSRTQHRYLLVFQDLFTRYVELRPFRQANAKSVWKALYENVILRWVDQSIF